MLQCVGPSCYALVIDLGTLCDDTIAPQNITGTRGCLDDPKALVMVRKWVASSSIDVVSMWRFPKMLLSPKLSVFIGFSIVNHSFWGTPIYRAPHVVSVNLSSKDERMRMGLTKYRIAIKHIKKHMCWNAMTNHRNKLAKTSHVCGVRMDYDQPQTAQKCRLWARGKANQSGEKWWKNPLQLPSFTPKCPVKTLGGLEMTWGIFRPKSIFHHTMEGFRPTMSGPWGWPCFSCLAQTLSWKNPEFFVRSDGRSRTHVAQGEASLQWNKDSFWKAVWVFRSESWAAAPSHWG